MRGGDLAGVPGDGEGRVPVGEDRGDLAHGVESEAVREGSPKPISACVSRTASAKGPPPGTITARAGRA